MVEGVVSTIIPVYNRARMLEEAVASVLAQTYRAIEIIIVDDGSTDDTPAICNRLAEEHGAVIRIIHQANGGVGAAREAGRRLARGEFIQNLDSDDRLHPTKFEKQVAALRNNSECGVAYCKTRALYAGRPWDEKPSLRTGERLATLFPYFLSGRCWQTVTPLFRRAVCDQVGPWIDLRQDEDLEYDARVAALGTQLAWCPEFLADYCNHDGPRAGGGWWNDPERMRCRYRAHKLIYEHARRAGISTDDPHMQRFARFLFLLARQCGAAGLAQESRELFDLAREASGEKRRQRWDFRLYRAAAAALGWSGVGRLACWADRFRSTP